MANKVFSSYSNSKNNDVDQQLIIEIGATHLACYLKNEGKQTIKDFELFKFDKESSNNFKQLFEDISEKSSVINKPNIDTKVFINNEASIMVPASGFVKENAADYLKLVIGEKAGCTLLVDDLHINRIYNVYLAPAEWIEVLGQYLNNLETKHLYTNVVEQLLQENAHSELLKVIFYDDYIIVALIINKNLHFIQTFTYQAEQDVLYYLLSISHRFNLQTNDIVLQLSGMLDVKSNLYNDLKKYFKRLSIEELEGNHLQLNLADFSKHNFIPYFNLSK